MADQDYGIEASRESRLIEALTGRTLQELLNGVTGEARDKLNHLADSTLETTLCELKSLGRVMAGCVEGQDVGAEVRDLGWIVHRMADRAHFYAYIAQDLSADHRIGQARKTPHATAGDGVAVAAPQQ